jgi:hypothetical protein
MQPFPASECAQPALDGSRLHVAPPVARQSCVGVHGVGSLTREPSARALVAAVVVEDAARDDAEVFGEVEGGGDDEEGEKEEQDRVCVR